MSTNTLLTCFARDKETIKMCQWLWQKHSTAIGLVKRFTIHFGRWALPLIWSLQVQFPVLNTATSALSTCTARCSTLFLVPFFATIISPLHSPCKLWRACCRQKEKQSSQATCSWAGHSQFWQVGEPILERDQTWNRLAWWAFIVLSGEQQIWSKTWMNHYWYRQIRMGSNNLCWHSAISILETMAFAHVARSCRYHGLVIVQPRLH
jgi:hypothetical protein